MKHATLLTIFILFVLVLPYSQANASDAANKLKGRILLQVESKGEAWYVNPKDGKRYYMANGTEAYSVMRNLGVGVNNTDLNKIKTDKSIAKKQQGKIFLQIESKGEAYYIDNNGNAHYLRDGTAAYQIMRQLGLGIKNTDLEKIELSIKDESLKMYQVVKVIDGDTIEVSINGVNKTLRLIGLDTPETLDPRKPVQCFGQVASNRAKELMQGKKVRLEADATQGELDMYGRLLRYVWLEDGTLYNLKMVKDGYAHEYTYNTAFKYQVQFKTAQKEAQDNLRGFWAPNTCNGDTAKIATSTTNTITATSTNLVNDQLASKYHTSSYGTSKYYYPPTCDGWRTLTANYLKSFDTLAALLKDYPARIISPACQ